MLTVAGEQGGFRLDFTEVPVGLRILPARRTDDGSRCGRDAAWLRRDLPRGDRLAVSARPHHRARAAPAAAPAAAAIRQPATDAPAAGHHVAARRPDARRTSTWSACARTPKASTAESAAGCTAGTPDELAEQTGVFTRRAHRAHRTVRVPVRRVAAAKDARQRHEIERASALDGPVGRGGRRDRQGVSARRATASTTWTRLPRGWSRTRTPST